MVSLAKSFERMLAKVARDLKVPYPFPDLQFPLSFKDLKYLSYNPKDPIEGQKWLENLLLASPDRSGFRLAWLTALERLRYGETHPMLRATKQNRKVNWTILQLKLMAIAFVNYRKERGMKKYKAQQEVGDAFGLDRHTIRTWESRLRPKFEAKEFSKMLAYAEKNIEESNPQQSLFEFARLYKLEKKRAKNLPQK